MVAAGAVALSANATVINGGISFNGNVTAYLNSTGTGTIATDYTLAHSLVFSTSFVSAGANGSFMGIAVNTPVLMYSPLQVNPPGLPVPATSALWTVGIYSFTLSTLTEPLDTSTALELVGSGIMSDGNPADSNTGTWTATFTTSGSTFSWNSSSSATAATVPEAGTSLLLLGLGLTALGAYAQFRKQAV